MQWTAQQTEQHTPRQLVDILYHPADHEAFGLLLDGESVTGPSDALEAYVAWRRRRLGLPV